jgi:hypothetical protein
VEVAVTVAFDNSVDVIESLDSGEFDVDALSDCEAV